MSELGLDHLVYAVPDLAAGVADLAARLGVEPTPGGQHVGLGTRNALVALGPTAYLEVIGPDPDQPPPAAPRPFGVDDLTAGRLVTWAAHTSDIAAVVERSRAAGFDPGDPFPMQRATPDGTLLCWQLTLRAEAAGDGLVPFVIDWGTTPTPATTSAGGVELLSFRGEHPDPGAVLADLAALGIGLDVTTAAEPALVAELRGPAGTVRL